MSHSLEADLVVTALHLALRHRRPPPGCIHHSDQGVQYACHEYTDLLKHYGFAISMYRKGNPYDNAVCESFFKTLKNEEVYLTEYHTAEEAQASIRHFSTRSATRSGCTQVSAMCRPPNTNFNTNKPPSPRPELGIRVQ